MYERMSTNIKLNFGERLVGFCYSKFKNIGDKLAKSFPKVDHQLEAAGKRIYGPAYFSTIFFFSLLAGIISTSLAIILYLILGTPLTLILLAAPLAVFGFGLVWPSMSASSLASMLDSEVPYAATYLSVMSTGGIPPYKSLKRLSKSELMPNLSKAATLAEVDVEVLGNDPVTSLEEMARNLPSEEYRDLIMGYASTLRSGGDVVHYLLRKTEQIFALRTAKMKMIGERMGMLMESYASVAMMLSLVIYTIFIISKAMPSEYMTMDVGQFAIFGYIIMPLLCGIFIFLADISQPKYPTGDKSVYKVFFISMIPGIAFIILFVMPFFTGDPRSLPTSAMMIALRELLGLEYGYETPLGLCLAFLIMFIPPTIVYHLKHKESQGVFHGITLFLRDLTETRKTGMSPEKAILTLQDRPYGRFKKYLEKIAKQISWGVDFKTIYNDFAQRVKDWMPRAMMFILIDAIDVGGGSPETLDTLAKFAEDLERLEKEKKATLKPLMAVPYISALLLIIIVVVLVSFMRSLLSIAHMGIALSEFIQFFLPPVVITAAISGLLAGKVSSGTVAAGFFHSVIMIMASMIAIIVSGHLSLVFFKPLAGGV